MKVNLVVFLKWAMSRNINNMLTEREKMAIFVVWMRETKKHSNNRTFGDALDFMFHEGLINSESINPFMKKYAEYIAEDERRTKELKKLLA